MKYAGFLIRLIANIIDLVILAIPVIIVVFVEPKLSSEVIKFLSTIYLSLCNLYFLLESTPWQGTIGKKVVGIIVTDLDGKRISVLQSFVRCFAQSLSVISFGIGYVMILFTREKQSLHDKIAKTLVIYKGEVK